MRVLQPLAIQLKMENWRVVQCGEVKRWEGERISQPSAKKYHKFFLMFFMGKIDF